MGIFKKDNRWVADWYEKGKRKRQFFGTESEARRGLATVLQQRGKVTSPRRPRALPALVDLITQLTRIANSLDEIGRILDTAVPRPRKEPDEVEVE